MNMLLFLSVNKRICLSLIFLLFLFIKFANGQENLLKDLNISQKEFEKIDFDKIINYINVEENRPVLVFVNVEKKAIIKIYDISKNNPFNYLGSKTYYPDGEVLSFERKELADLFPNFDFNYYAREDVKRDTMLVSQVSVVHRLFYSNNIEFVGVSYTCIANYYGPRRTVLIIFDKNGNEISKLCFDLNISELIITDNGKYIIHTFGLWEVEGDEIIKTGVQVHSTIDRKKIFDKGFNRLAGMSINKKFITLGSHNYYSKNGTEVINRMFFDFHNLKVYTREFNVNCLGKSEIVDNGVIMQCLDGSSYKLYFNEDFEITELK